MLVFRFQALKRETRGFLLRFFLTASNRVGHRVSTDTHLHLK